MLSLMPANPSSFKPSLRLRKARVLDLRGLSGLGEKIEIVADVMNSSITCVVVKVNTRASDKFCLL